MSAPPSGILFYDPRVKPLSTVGLIQPGCYFQFYLTGTTTLASVYADAALTIALSQTPGSGQTTAASDGRLIPIYLNPATVYRVQLYSAVGVLLEDTDPFVVPLTSATSLVGVSVVSYGADASGATDSSAAFQSALNAVSGGGTVFLPSGGKFKLNSSITIPANVTLKGPQSFIGAMVGNNGISNYVNQGGSIALSSAATITLSSGACIDGILVYRQGMTFPATDSTSFAGTALTIAGDDATVANCMILGFNLGIFSSGYQRPTIHHVKLDNQNGVEITNCLDIPYIFECHAWPFATIQPGALAAALQRTGTAYYLHDIADWGKLTNCFCFGYKFGFDIVSVNSPTLMGCSVDGTSGVNVIAGSRGFSIRSTTNDAKIIACQAASQEIGFYCDTVGSPEVTNHFHSCVAWAESTHGFFFGAGDAELDGGRIYNVPNALTYTNAASTVLVRGVTFGVNVTLPINVATAVAATSDKLQLRDCYFPSTATGSNPVGGSGTYNALVIASAGQLNIPPQGEFFTISGTTGIGNIHEGWSERRITLFFQGIVTVTNGTGAVNALRLSGGANFITSAGATLTLGHNGTQWYEIGRSA